MPADIPLDAEVLHRFLEGRLPLLRAAVLTEQPLQIHELHRPGLPEAVEEEVLLQQLPVLPAPRQKDRLLPAPVRKSAQSRRGLQPRLQNLVGKPRQLRHQRIQRRQKPRAHKTGEFLAAVRVHRADLHDLAVEEQGLSMVVEGGPLTAVIPFQIKDYSSLHAASFSLRRRSAASFSLSHFCLFSSSAARTARANVQCRPSFLEVFTRSRLSLLQFSQEQRL